MLPKTKMIEADATDEIYKSFSDVFYMMQEKEITVNELCDYL